MRTYGTGMTRQRIGVEWPSPVEVVRVVEPEPVIIHAEPLPPLHLCEVPPEMYPARAKLASAWFGLQPGADSVKAKPPTKATVRPKKSTTKPRMAKGRKNTKSKG